MMQFMLVFFVVSIGAAVSDSNYTVWTLEMIQEAFDNADPKRVDASTPELIEYDNYTAEVHYVTTEDGYILQMHRIPASPTSPAADGKPVVFVMHGILCSSADWVIMGPDQGLAYILADAGYDVWLGNARGNTYSKNHSSSTISDEQFWDFSWNEIGYYDLPTMIDYALETTGQDQLIYIGHSQGTTSFFVMTSLRPEYNDKILMMAALAPVAYMGNLKNPLARALAPETDAIKLVADGLGVYDLATSESLIGEAAATYCPDDDATRFLCGNIIFALGGYDPAQLNMSTIPIIYEHFPAGTSTRQLAHYGQEVNSGKFRKYDYGLIKNMVKYGSLTPPDYDLSKVTADVLLVYSGNDLLSAVEDVTQLHNELPNVVEMRRVAWKEWQHFDYIWGINATELVYELLIATFKSNYSSS